jgi:hypothetical protein
MQLFVLFLVSEIFPESWSWHHTHHDASSGTLNAAGWLRFKYKLRRKKGAGPAVQRESLGNIVLGSDENTLATMEHDKSFERDIERVFKAPRGCSAESIDFAKDIAAKSA